MTIPRCRDGTLIDKSQNRDPVYDSLYHLKAGEINGNVTLLLLLFLFLLGKLLFLLLLLVMLMLLCVLFQLSPAQSLTIRARAQRVHR